MEWQSFRVSSAGGPEQGNPWRGIQIRRPKWGVPRTGSQEGVSKGVPSRSYPELGTQKG
jgi:hypothetical protein